MPFFFFALLYFVFIPPIVAQEPYAINLNEQYKLPSNTVYQIYQDGKGYMWLATDGGLLKYNGIQFTQYRSNSLSSYAGSYIQEDAQSRIWHQNFDGNVYFTSGDSLVQCVLQKEIGNYAIHQDTLWLINSDGISQYETSSFKLLNSYQFKKKCLVRAAALSNNQYYVFMDQYLLRFNAKLKVDTLGFFPNNNNQVPLLFSTKEGVVLTYRQAKKGAFWLIKNHSMNMEVLPFNGHEPIQSISLINNQYWILTTEGCFVYENSKLKHHWFQTYSASNIIKDNRNKYWITTLNNGILLIPNISNQFTSVNPHKIQQSFFAKDKILFINRKNQVLSLTIDGDRPKVVFTIPGKAQTYFSKYNAHNNCVYLSSSGFYEYNFSTGTFKGYPFALKDLDIINMQTQVLATSGNILLMQMTGGIASSWQHYIKEENKIAPNLFSIKRDVKAKSISYQPNDTCIYAATNIGLLAIKPGSEIKFKWNDAPIQIQQVITIGKYTFALSYQGILFRINGIELIPINESALNGIQHQILSISSYENTLLALSQKGIAVIQVNPNNTFKISRQALPIDVRDIIKVRLRNGFFQIITKEGLLQIPHSSIGSATLIDTFFIDKVLVNNKEISGNGSLIPYNFEGIKIHYALLNYGLINASDLSYRVNLGEWQKAAPESRELSFPSLSPGSYHIEFMLNGILLDRHSVDFVIQSPFWLRWWFLAMVGIGMFVISYLYYNRRLSIQVLQNQVLAEKLKLEEELHQSTLVAIRSQMNPHFFFNALNTIQSYIFSNDKIKASHYLSKFSKLTRNILEMTGKDRIRLNEEIESLTFYLQLEQMRFEDNFQFSIKLDPQLEADSIYIMPMLIQPYVENAIKHGLLHLRGEKKLEIHIDFPQFNLLQITIDDNGIGRAKSASLQQYKAGNHIPFATIANKKRLDILQQNQSAKAGVKFIDKTNEQGNSTGTTVILTIPIS